MSFEVPRLVLPNVLNRLGLTGQGVEVGVFRGEFSEHILRIWRGRRLWMVDPWRPLDDYEEAHDHEDNRCEALRRVEPYGERACPVRETSQKAAALLPNGLDFVYLDANHSYEAVKADLAAWYPKIKRGGLFAGDDYGHTPEQVVDFGNGPMTFGVRRAVDEFARDRRLNVSINWLAQWYITQRDGSQSWARNWWLIKQE